MKVFWILFKVFFSITVQSTRCRRNCRSSEWPEIPSSRWPRWVPGCRTRDSRRIRPDRHRSLRRHRGQNSSTGQHFGRPPSPFPTNCRRDSTRKRGVHFRSTLAATDYAALLPRTLIYLSQLNSNFSFMHF